MFQRQLEVGSPQTFARGDLNGRHDKGGPIERVVVARMPADRHLRVPLTIDVVSQVTDRLQGLCIVVN